MLSLFVELFFGSSPKILCVHVASLLPGHVTPAAAVRCGCCLSNSVKVSHSTLYLLGLYLCLILKLFTVMAAAGTRKQTGCLSFIVRRQQDIHVC